MSIFSWLFYIFPLVFGDFVQVFPNTSMTSDDLIYRSKYLSQGISELEILFQAGTFGKSGVEIAFSMPKYTYDYIKGNKIQNNPPPKSLGVNTTILLKEGMKDTNIWNLEESNIYNRVFYDTTFNYFILNGVKGQRMDLNSNPCDSYTIACEFLIQGTENNFLQNYGKLTGLVSLLVPKTSTASTSLQAVLLNLTESQIFVNTSITSTFKTCSFLVNDCSISQNIYKLNEDAIFLFKLDDPQFHDFFYLSNLKVAMKIDNDAFIDVTPIINILSTTLGEVKFSLNMMIIPQNSITISVVATLKSSSRRLETNQPQGIVNYEIIYFSDDIQTETVLNHTIGYFYSMIFLMIILLVII